MGDGRKIWLTILGGVVLGAAVGAVLGNITVGIVYGVVVGVAFGFWVDRRIRTRPPVG
jgi:F0F1-type ATP synthase assembly protein I